MHLLQSTATNNQLTNQPHPPPSSQPPRLGALDSELTKLKDKQSSITEKWQSEKGEMTKLQAIKEEIERVNLEVQQAERDYDLNR